MKHITFWVVLIVVAAGLQLVTRMAPSAKQAKQIAPASVSKIDGTALMRLTLLPDAVKRLDIKTVLVREEPIVASRKFAGDVVAITSDRNAAVVRVNLTENDVKSVRRDGPALIQPLARDNKTPGLQALPARQPSPYALAGPFGATHYEVGGPNHGLVNRQLVFVELPLTSSGENRKIIPYAAVLYDAKGNTWVYTNPQPLVFIRHSIQIDAIVGDKVILVAGPPVGTAVVTVGGAELFGAEFGVGK